MNLAVPRRQPLTGVALSAIAGILLAEFLPFPVPFLGAALALGAIVSLVRPRWWLTHLLVVAFYFALHQAQQHETPGRLLNARLGDRPRVVTVTGMVASEPTLSPSEFSTFLLRLKSIEVEGRSEPNRATIQARWKASPRLGDEIRLTGLAEPIPPPRNPGVFDLRAYLARRDVFQSIFVRYPENGAILRVGGGNPVVRAAARAREWMRTNLTRDLEDSPEVAALITGMALGLRHESPNDVEEPFQQSGTLHLFSVSGLHVAIIAQLLWIVFSLLRLPRTAAAALIIPCLFFYAAITGFHVSSLRAATMAAFLLGGIFFDRPILALNSLGGAALVILALDSNQFFTAGFQLSFAVVAAILLCQNRFFTVLLRPAATDPFLPRSLVSRGRRFGEASYRFVASGLSVSAAAWAGSLLLILWYFYLITPVSLVANLAVVPVAFCVLAVGMLSLVVAPFSSALALVFANANWTLAHLILGLAQFFAQLPTGHAYVERPRWPTGARAEITVLDAGPGAAMHLRAGGRDWLFDAGSARDYERFLRDYLHARGIDRLDGLLLTHGDSQHLGGAGLLLDEFRPRRVLDNGAPDRSRVHQELIVRLKAREIAAQDFALKISREVTARVLFPPAGLKTKAADDQALVVQLLIAGKHRVLLVSDSGPETERALLAQPNDLRSDILIKGQHYSGASGSAEFLDAVRPRLIVASSIDFPARERIPDEWAEMVRARGIQLLRQDESGAVTAKFFRDTWSATPFIAQPTLRSTSR